MANGLLLLVVDGFRTTGVGTQVQVIDVHDPAAPSEKLLGTLVSPAGTIAPDGTGVFSAAQQFDSRGTSTGIGGLGTWFTEGYQSDKSDQIIAGIIAIFVLAIVVDTLIMFAGRLLTPWTRATSTGRAKAKAAA